MKTLIGSKNRSITGIALLFAIFSILNSCTKSSMSDMTGTGGDTGGSKGPGVNEVFIQNHAFNPSTITVAVNTTIKWTNKDPAVHTVTSDDGSFGSSGSLATNETFSFLFTTAGTYKYHCTPHPTMTATVIVN
jgi:plastocyanin